MNNSWGTLTIETTVTVDGRMYEVSATSSIQVSIDPNYGADADGNRGWSQTFVDESKMEIHSITIPGSKENLKDKLDKDTMSEIDAILEALEMDKDIDDYSFPVPEPNEPYEW